MKKKLLSILLCLMLVFAVGCSNDSGQKTITDREGNEVKVPNKIEKIISTAPSNTEILAGLGLADKIIAADTYSEGIEGLSKDTELMDFQTPDAEKIIELNPDIIIASGYNQVGSSEDPYKSVSDAGIPVVYIPSSNSIDGIYKDIAFIAELVGAKDKGDEMIASMKKEVDSIRTEIIKKEQYYKISGLTTEYNKIEILYNFTKDIKKYIWKDSIKTYLEEQNEPTEELDMLCNMMQNIKDRYKAFKKSVRFDGQIIEISGKEYADMVMKYALMLPEYNVKKAEKKLQDFKDNKINLLTNKEARKNKVEKVAKGTGEVVKEAIVYTGGSLVKNTIKSILHIS